MPPKIALSTPTQKDIAQALDLSSATVAIALNPVQRHRLQAETVRRVEAKAREMRYRPQRQARILRTGRSQCLGVIYQLGLYHAPAERIRHLARCAIRRGYHLVPVDQDWFEYDVGAVCNYLQDSAVEGIIFCNTSLGDNLQWMEVLRERLIPVVSVSGTIGWGDDAQWDIHSAFREMTQHHIAQGSRDLHLILAYHDVLPEGSTPNPVIHNRVHGFAEAIRAAGGEVTAAPPIARYFQLPPHPVSIREGTLRGQVHYPQYQHQYKNAFDVGYYEAIRILRATDARPNSLVCSNDDIAAGAVTACHELGRRIPEDTLVSGADNAPFSRYCGIPLTTIEQPSREMAEWSVQRIIHQIENTQNSEAPLHKIFPFNLIHRKSTQRSTSN